MDAPFHAGEIAVQMRVGVHERMAEVGSRVMRTAMPEQHRELFQKLPMMLVGSLDAHGRPWASMVVGAPGFIHAPDDRHLRLNTTPLPGDPLADHLAVDVPLGLLGIEPHTRRRNRMNGTVEQMDASGFTVVVDQSFGNCPQYIQARQPSWVDAEGPPPVRLSPALHQEALALIRHSDTLFIATASARPQGHAGAQGVDVSHRGGPPGFVRIDVNPATSRTTLTLPDYRGNFMFNTLGNIAANPRAGLFFFDPSTGDVLQATGSAAIVWDEAQIAAFPGAQRLLQVHIDEALWRAGTLPLRWTAAQYAPQFEAMGISTELGA
ncbi:pyridoxamine 5'-phosphate oxidase family protein [Piscinibacter terrae]|uniref:Flavin-nucleotide-binding protein n=1 Tax=Piscinibacter terrae TaxID=2496871 RepID=A0A3N7JPJ1_9BURK|nr:pyridoxamine 5'-phosphate oxidase family protein [Albitalea terrae]RQP22979.1 flavin-nucleotide-binding protein [Albitalea terrae]